MFPRSSSSRETKRDPPGVQLIEYSYARNSAESRTAHASFAWTSRAQSAQKPALPSAGGGNERRPNGVGQREPGDGGPPPARGLPHPRPDAGSAERAGGRPRHWLCPDQRAPSPLPTRHPSPPGAGAQRRQRQERHARALLARPRLLPEAAEARTGRAREQRERFRPRGARRREKRPRPEEEAPWQEQALSHARPAHRLRPNRLGKVDRLPEALQRLLLRRPVSVAGHLGDGSDQSRRAAESRAAEEPEEGAPAVLRADQTATNQYAVL